MVPSVLYAYGDESGLHASPKYCLVAGYIGLPDQWDTIEPEWESVLAEYAITGGFHAHRFFSGRKPYRTWDRVKRDGLLDRLVEIISQHEMYPIGAAVEVNAFYTLPEPQREYFTGAKPEAVIERYQGALTVIGEARRVRLETKGRSAPQQPYRVAVLRFLAQAVNYTPADCRLHIVLGSHNTLASGVVEYINNHFKMSDALASVTYAKAAQTPLLQAADLYAYLMARRLSGVSMEEREISALKAIAVRHPSFQLVDTAQFAGEWAVFLKDFNDELNRRGAPSLC